MANDWIIDVLDDLTRFARLNGMTALSDQLDQTMRVAREEVGKDAPDANSCAKDQTG